MAAHVFQMPLRSLIALTADNHWDIANCEPGYEWIPQHFGPPPGVHKTMKKYLGYKSQSISINLNQFQPIFKETQIFKLHSLWYVVT